LDSKQLYYEITEDGFRADPIIPGTVTPNSLSRSHCRYSALHQSWRFVGTLVSRDQTSAMITAELLKSTRMATRSITLPITKLSKNRFVRNLKMRISISKLLVLPSRSAISLMCFFSVGFLWRALILTALAVYWYCHSLRFTILYRLLANVACVAVRSTEVAGFGLDPLGVLFLFVFAIGVRTVSNRSTLLFAKFRMVNHRRGARASFLVVNSACCLGDRIYFFATLIMIPIPMVRELAITASLGCFLKSLPI